MFIRWFCRPPLRYLSRQQPRYLKSRKSSHYGLQASNQVSGLDLKGTDSRAREQGWVPGCWPQGTRPAAGSRGRRPGLLVCSPPRRPPRWGAAGTAVGRSGSGRPRRSTPRLPGCAHCSPNAEQRPAGRSDPGFPYCGRAGRPRDPAFSLLPAGARPRPSGWQRILTALTA